MASFGAWRKIPRQDSPSRKLNPRDMVERLPIVGVMGSGTEATCEAQVVGRLLARMGVHLLTGGGGGQMKAVAQAFVQCPERKGLSLGILPCLPGEPLLPKSSGYPNAFVELPIRTHLDQSSTHPMSRNHINVLSSQALVFLWGASGTLSEARLARVYGTPRCLFVVSETLSRYPQSELHSEFADDEIFADDSELESWLRSRVGL